MHTRVVYGCFNLCFALKAVLTAGILIGWVGMQDVLSIYYTLFRSLYTAGISFVWL